MGAMRCWKRLPKSSATAHDRAAARFPSPPMMQQHGNWNYPTAVRFGAGRIVELGDAVRAAGMTRPLLVTDPTLARMPMTARALASLEAAGVATSIFCDVKANPVEANIQAGLAAFRDGGHDGVVALGGGSALDAGKLIAFMAGQVRPVWDFEDIGDGWTRADADAIAPVVAVPTTAGTGSEVGRAAVLTDPAGPAKKIIFHPRMLPRVALCDPELTVAMPVAITVGTGMDALAHCLEAFCAPAYHPLADGIAAEGIRLVKNNLLRATRQGDDIEARAGMMAAALMGATAFQKGLGAIHALSHPVGALHDTHHGLTNAVFMPYVLVFNRPAIEEQIARLAAYLGLRPSFASFLEWVLELRADAGVPATLADLGVDGAHLDVMARMAPADPSAAGNPRPLDAEAARGLLEAAWSGRL
jgi:alcohol dehydrogenase class IV